MNRIGFMVSDQETEQPEERGFAEPQHVQDEEHWTDGLGNFFFRNLVGFFMIYGFFAAVRDLISLL